MEMRWRMCRNKLAGLREGWPPGGNLVSRRMICMSVKKSSGSICSNSRDCNRRWVVQ
jgi:hypothetical protein